MIKPMKKPQLHAGDDAVEHGDQTGDSTLHTRVNHCDFDLINVKAEK